MNKTERLELRELASYVQDIPPLELWKKVQSKIEPQDWGLTIHRWSFLARYLEAYSSDDSAPEINDFIRLENKTVIFKGDRPELWGRGRISFPDTKSAQEAANLYRKHINAICNYYLQTSILVFQAHKDISKTASELLGEKISYKGSRIMKFLLLEEFIGQTNIFLSEFWESSSPTWERDFLPQIPYLLKNTALHDSKIIPLKSSDHQIQKVMGDRDDREDLLKQVKDKLLKAVNTYNNLTRISNLDFTDFWSKRAWFVFYENQQKYPNYNSWVSSISNRVEITTSRGFPLRKHFYQDGKYYPSKNKGRKKRKTS